MQGWRSGARGRRRAVFGLALAAHVGLVVLMLQARTQRDRREEAVVAMIVLQPPPRAPARAPAPAPAPASRVTRLRALPRAVVEPRTITAPVVEARAASAAAPVASAASQPLRLTLTRDELRALIASGPRPTLAQSLARPAPPSALASLGGEPDEEIPLAGGVTEVHVHGNCFRLVPTPRAQYDPFNHANERLTSRCN